MNKNLNYNKKPYNVNYPQPIPTHSFDFPDKITVTQPVTQHQEFQDPSCSFATFDGTTTMQHRQFFPVLNYLKFYYLSPNDFNFYLVICKIIQQNSFDNHNHHDHEFFYQHPRYPSLRYHVTCKLLPYSSVENILNNEECRLNFGVKLLSLDQKFNLERNLREKLYYRMYYYDMNTNNNVANQTVSMEEAQIYDNDHITRQDTNVAKDNIVNPQQDDENLMFQQNNFGTTH
ncbi:hypothetical protein RclHR1_16640002 [Rhizophagus clarus]|uniref:Uncharacterized protein n=1 Tax=Rhizophagus clarus TaxID=94130 RepID=A0A2Z6QM79_9GLOM|nr:hypothetical protein RclHR1_16640002 [Rhizophagus clarus]GES83831.1 hypothetical protein GLOIN_2v1763712 [Rhizophagus clarus]